MRDDEIVDRAIVKADSGWFVFAFDESEKLLFSCGPVIAWSIKCRTTPDKRAFFDVDPITVDGETMTMSNRWCLKQPDGNYVIQCLVGPVTENEMLKYFREGGEGG